MASPAEERELAALVDYFEQPQLTLFEVLLYKPGLEVPGNHGFTELARARAKIARSLHPDRLGQAPAGLRERAERAMARVNVAYDTLNDPAAARRYFLTELSRTHAACAACNASGRVSKRKGFSGPIRYELCPACSGYGWVRKGFE